MERLSERLQIPSTKKFPQFELTIRNTGGDLREKILREKISQYLFSKIFLLLILLILFSTSSSLSQNKIAKVYQLEAAFLYNFTRFVNWSSNAGSSDQPPFVIGILGPDPFEGYLDELVRGETVGGKRIEVRRYDNVNQADKCAMLFINLSEGEKIKQALLKVKKQGVLTVADSQGFARRGGVIEFFIEENKVRLKINVEAAKAEGLEISSKLLNLAKVY